jgi:hypothetical protein
MGMLSGFVGVSIGYRAKFRGTRSLHVTILTVDHIQMLGIIASTILVSGSEKLACIYNHKCIILFRNINCDLPEE